MEYTELPSTQQVNETYEKNLRDNLRTMWELYPRTNNDETIEIDDQKMIITPAGRFGIAVEEANGFYRYEFIGRYDFGRGVYVWDDGREWNPYEEMPELESASSDSNDSGEEERFGIGEQTIHNRRDFE
jgi:hypothetical protein